VEFGVEQARQYDYPRIVGCGANFAHEIEVVVPAQIEVEQDDIGLCPGNDGESVASIALPATIIFGWFSMSILSPARTTV